MRDGLKDTAHHQPEQESHQENDEMRHDAPCAHANAAPRAEPLLSLQFYAPRLQGCCGRESAGRGGQRASAIAESPRP